MLKAIKADLSYDIPHDNKNSGQALAQILAEKSNPVGDIGYFGVDLRHEGQGRRTRSSPTSRRSGTRSPPA